MMIRNISIGSFDKFWYQVAFFMMSFYLLADMLTGFSIIYLGVDLKISLIYKTLLFFLLLILLFNLNSKLAIYFLMAILLSFIGCFTSFFIYSTADYLLLDFLTLIKIFTSILVFIFLNELSKVDLEFFNLKSKQVLTFSYTLITSNLLLGTLGIGKMTYKVGDGETAGSTGLIMAGNELGGAFLVVFGYVLFQVWNSQKYKKYYIFQAGFTLFCGLIVSTKTTILAALVLVFFVPLVSEREKLLKMTLLKLKVFTPLIIVVSVLVYMILDFLERLNLLGRIMWFYEKNGIFGILFSGRDVMVMERMNTYLDNSSLFQQIFGQGFRIELSERYMKSSTEVDSVDVLGFYGVIFLLFISFFYVNRLLLAFKLMRNKSAIDSPVVFLISFLLLCLSQISGHIWTSGTIAIVFGVLIARCQLEVRLSERSKVIEK
ncbi:hypothetical protein [Pseudoalteromonas mariniglutinosa]|uniref:hypothetical protein n=1 Tax=Pseudoalteromonas mariniglutinosa TaxID=206042 RepID=UPI00384F4636